MIFSNDLICNMDRNKLSKDIVSKMSGYTWITLGKISDNNTRLNIAVTTEGDDASIFRSKIESLGCSMLTTFQNKATVMGNINSLLNLAKSGFVKHVEVGLPMSYETTDTYLE